MFRSLSRKASVLAESSDIRHLAQRAFASYIRSAWDPGSPQSSAEPPSPRPVRLFFWVFLQVRLMKDKEIFDVQDHLESPGFRALHFTAWILRQFPARLCQRPPLQSPWAWLTCQRWEPSGRRLCQSSSLCVALRSSAQLSTEMLLLCSARRRARTQSTTS